MDFEHSRETLLPSVDEVLIDVSRLVYRSMMRRLPTGVDRVSLAYVAHFAPRARAVVRTAGRIIVLSRAGSDRLFAHLLAPGPDCAGAAWRIVGLEGLRLPQAGWMRGRFLFNTSHSSLDSPAYRAQLRRQGGKPLFLVHDLIPLTHPEHCRAGERDRHAARMETVLDVACGVIANSEATLEELRRYARKKGKPMPAAVAAPLAPWPLPPPSPERPLDGPYFVMLGTIEPRKNHWLMLQLWRRLVERYGQRAPSLVIIGRRGWEYENVEDMLERCEALRGKVFERNACIDAEVSTFLRHAQALLFPSFAEGYGMPLAEALAAGVPVIASDLPVFHAIAGDIPEYVDPLDAPRWMGLIEHYARDGNSAREAQKARMAGFRARTWKEHFEVVEAFVESLGKTGYASA